MLEETYFVMGTIRLQEGWEGGGGGEIQLAQRHDGTVPSAGTGKGGTDGTGVADGRICCLPRVLSGCNLWVQASNP